MFPAVSPRDLAEKILKTGTVRKESKQRKREDVPAFNRHQQSSQREASFGPVARRPLILQKIVQDRLSGCIRPGESGFVLDYLEWELDPGLPA
jgi:hypothetical protein